MLRRALRILLALTISVGTIAVLLWLFASNGGWYAPTTKDHSIKIVEGSEIYMVPANYIWSGHDRQSATTGQVNYHMLYPGAEPRTKVNEEIFNLPGWAGGRLVSFVLKSKAGMGFLEGYIQEEKEAREKNQITKVGDWLQIPSSIDGYVLLKTKALNGEDIYIRCTKPTEHIKHPSCNKYFSLTDSTYVQFTFSRSRIDEWQLIEAELASLMNKFRIKN